MKNKSIKVINKFYVIKNKHNNYYLCDTDLYKYSSGVGIVYQSSIAKYTKVFYILDDCKAFISKSKYKEELIPVKITVSETIGYN